MHESKHKLFHVNVMRMIPYSAENPRQSSRLMKFSSNLIIFQQDATYSVGKLLNSIHDARTHIYEVQVICATLFKRELTKGTALSEYSVAQILLQRLLSYQLLNTSLLTPWSRVLFEKVTGFQVVK